MRLNILISAYACEPNRGSEPGVGWQWALALSRHHRVTVITRANNRESIESFFHGIPVTKEVPQFLYHDLPDSFLRLKRAGRFGLSLYYFLWQATLRVRFGRLASSFDILHHITFNSFRLPGFWWLVKTQTVLGPLGGGQVTSKHYLPIFRESRWRERLRSVGVYTTCLNLLLRFSCQQANLILAANSATEKILSRISSTQVVRMLETGIEEKVIRSPQRRAWTGNILWVGTLEKWKAGEIAIRAVAEARKSRADLRLTMIGGGSDLAFLRSLAQKLDLSQHVEFLGSCPIERVDSEMLRSSLFLFTSIRDTSGNVVLEAMSNGLPVIAIRHHGVAEICTGESALLIEPADVEKTVKDIADGIIRLANDEDARYEMAVAASNRLLERFTWSSKASKMSNLYMSLFAKEPSNMHKLL
jgi:glycosyltransferase involved in cell wall biosynthesis